jgi:hypothetical protein
MGFEDGKMTKYQGSTRSFMGASLEVPAASPRQDETGLALSEGKNVVVKRERLFTLLQEEHLQERIKAREERPDSPQESAGIFRLHDGGPLPEVKPMEAEDSDPTSRGVTHFS